MGLNIFSTSFD